MWPLATLLLLSTKVDTLFRWHHLKKFILIVISVSLFRTRPNAQIIKKANTKIQKNLTRRVPTFMGVSITTGNIVLKRTVYSPNKFSIDHINSEY